MGVIASGGTQVGTDWEGTKGNCKVMVTLHILKGFELHRGKHCQNLSNVTFKICAHHWIYILAKKKKRVNKYWLVVNDMHALKLMFNFLGRNFWNQYQKLRLMGG